MSNSHKTSIQTHGLLEKARSTVVQESNYPVGYHRCPAKSTNLICTVTIEDNCDFLQSYRQLFLPWQFYYHLSCNFDFLSDEKDSDAKYDKDECTKKPRNNWDRHEIFFVEKRGCIVLTCFLLSPMFLEGTKIHAEIEEHQQVFQELGYLRY